MIDIDHNEALLLRLLTSVFGVERVVPFMRVISVVGGSLPQAMAAEKDNLEDWARENNCLFTIVDEQDDPKLVVEFFSGFDESVDLYEVEHKKYLSPILKAAGIAYVTISEGEFHAVLDPEDSLDIPSLIGLKIGLQDEI